MRNYTTQMDAARKGIVTPEIEIVAKKENMTTEALMKLVAEGKVAICANKNHTSLDPEGVGSMLRTKINVNLGVSRDCKDYNIEMEKVMSAVNLGAEAIMDLSSHGNTQPFRQKLTHECPAMIGTVPVYDSVIHYQRDLATLTAQDFIDVVRLHAEDGVDFVTLHCGITRKTIEQIKKHKRKMNIVSRGGSLVFAWMCMTGEENPFYEHYDEILDICEEYDVTISLGDACRPGCLADATDVCQIEELVRLGELTKRAWDHNVQVMVEGPGHVPLDQVAANMKVQQSICMGAPFYVLGPLVTDIAPGYDHITSAIGGAVAAMNGAAFLCYVTPAEHLALPNVDDVKQGIIASKIAAHAADIAKGVPGARDIDDKMAEARQKLDWDAQYACALDPETAKAIREMDRDVSIIFVTSYKKYAIDCINCGPLRFLVKPVQLDALKEAVDSIIKLITEKRETISFKENGDDVRLYCDEIIFCESNGHMLTLYTKEGQFCTRINIGELEEHLKKAHFFRPHKSYLINMRYLKRICDKDVELYGTSLRIPLSRNKKSALHEAFVAEMERRYVV